MRAPGTAASCCKDLDGSQQICSRVCHTGPPPIQALPPSGGPVFHGPCCSSGTGTGPVHKRRVRVPCTADGTTACSHRTAPKCHRKGGWRSANAVRLSKNSRLSLMGPWLPNVPSGDEAALPSAGTRGESDPATPKDAASVCRHRRSTQVAPAALLLCPQWRAQAGHLACRAPRSRARRLVDHAPSLSESHSERRAHDRAARPNPPVAAAAPCARPSPQAAHRTSRSHARHAHSRS
eukprot:7385753-Prymnesium_polylepis.1